MITKKLLKWLVLQVAAVIILVSVVEFIYYLKLKHRIQTDCSSFDLPLRVVPYQKNNTLGYINPADTVIHLHSFQYDSVERNITYTFGPGHWRMSCASGSSNNYAMFLGCSYTFGYGLNDSETIASKFAEYNPAFHAYNFGVNGYGTANLLEGFENNVFKPLIKESDGICIYTVIDYHINRNIGDMNSSGNWAADCPCYELKDDTIEYAGTFATAKPARTWLFKLLAKSNIIKYYHLNFPKIKESDVILTARMIKKMQALYKQQFGNNNFYVLLYPDQYFDIRPYLRQYKIKYIEFSGLDLTKPEFRLLCDNHPSVPAIDTLTKLLGRWLQADSFKPLTGGK